ncbi:MAG: hypothetical protein HY512_04450 [Candidatus Aenigmarchaeota archaeon]|nr:hypothetical protein [Candidatus Aenigmarchaeota archaeon]
MGAESEIYNKILSTFAEVASSIGYSPLHGKIIGVLLIKNRPVSLQELAKATGYSSSMLSLSLDFLEILEVVKKVKKEADRKLYVSLAGDLLECLKRAITIKIEKSIQSSLSEFESSKKELTKLNAKEKAEIVNSLEILESQIKRLNKYVVLLSQIRLP